MIPKREKDTDISSEIAQGKYFAKLVKKTSEEVATRFMKGESLNSAVADISNREKFNQLQIQRLIEESNTIAFVKKYNTLKNKNDRRISFELAELSSVLELMGDQAPPEVDNPNWVKGKPGEGEMNKSASYSIHTPGTSVDLMREKMHARRKETELRELEKKAKILHNEIEGGLFKISNVIVQSEKVMKNGNQVFNTLLSDLSFDNTLTDGIIKKAESIATAMVNTKRVPNNFELELTVDPIEKTASVLLGKNSLLKVAELQKIEQPKIAPIQDIGDYKKLVDLAKEIQKKQQESLKVEQNLHGGVGNVK